VYKKLAKSGRFKIAFCWAHTRRDFVNLGKSYPWHVAWAQHWIDTIGELYRINGLRREASQAEDVRAEAAAKKKLRSLIKEMAQIRDEELADDDLPEERAKVLTRLLDHWDGLTLFLDSAWIPMDNNEAERLLRNPVVGRKNYYGSGAVWSGQLAATLFSVFQTLQIWDINPRLWLTSYFEACAASGGMPPSNIEDFLPWTMSEEKRRSFAAIKSDVA
ncbi:MAG: transposase, partial [Myxococcota bacterium]